MKYQIKHRWTNAVLFETEAVSFKVAVELAIRAGADLYRANLYRANLYRANLYRANLTEANLTGADLTGCNLTGADLYRADLYRADLTGCNLTGADLTGADLYRADLYRANLYRADLTGANLTRADLTGANLTEADLRHIKHDIWGVLLHALPEVDGLRQALIDGKVNGSVYEGECACLCGTIANIRHTSYTQLDGIQPDSSSAAERWFMGIKTGDTPETNPISRLTVEWIDEFTRLVKN